MKSNFLLVIVKHNKVLPDLLKLSDLSQMDKETRSELGRYHIEHNFTIILEFIDLLG